MLHEPKAFREEKIVMAVTTILVPDGKGGQVEVYTAPLYTKDANAWLQRAGANHLKFGTVKGKAVLKNNLTGQVIFRTDTISNLCYWIVFNPMQMKRVGISFYDWYRPDVAWNALGPVEVLL